MRITVICTVRNATDEYRKMLEDYKAKLEAKGYKVHLPHVDTNQKGTGWEICTQNGNAIRNSDEIHVFYNSESTGTHFDLGMVFMLNLLNGIGNPRIRAIENETFNEGKSFARMLHEWNKESEI